MKHHQEYLQQAIELAAQNAGSGQGGPYGAVIVHKGQVVAACANQVTATLDPSAHAEIVAIRSACQQLQQFHLQDCILYSSCEPCPMCVGAIYWARLQKVYFACTRDDAANAGFDDRLIYTEVALPPAARKIPMQAITVDDALLPFTVWKKLTTKISY